MITIIQVIEDILTKFLDFQTQKNRFKLKKNLNIKLRFLSIIFCFLLLLKYSSKALRWSLDQLHLELAL